MNATTTPASFTNQWVVKPKGDRAWRKTSAVKLKANLDYRNKYCTPEGSDAQLPRLPKSSKVPRFKDTKWVVRPKRNSAWKKAQISFAQQKMTSNVSNQLARDKTQPNITASSNSQVKFSDVPASGTSGSETTGAGAPPGPGAQ